MLSNERGYDLTVPKAKLSKLPHPPSARVVAELCDEGLWEDIPPLIDAQGDEVEPPQVRSLFRPEWQLPASFVEHQRQAAALRQERQRRHNSDDHAICTDRCKVIARRHDAGDHTLCTASPYVECPPVTRDVTRDPARSGSARRGLASVKDALEEEQQDEAPDSRVSPQDALDSWGLTAKGYDR